MNNRLYFLLVMLSLLVASCNREEPNAPVDDLPIYDGGRDIVFTDEELAFDTVRGVSQSMSAASNATVAEGLTALSLSWYLTEGATLYSEQPVSPHTDEYGDVIYSSIEFIPTAPASGDINSFVANIEQSVEDGLIERIFGFNPSTNEALTVDEALDKWSSLEYLELPLSSPIADMTDRAWFDEWMSRAESEGLRINYVAAEYYGKSYSIDIFTESLDDLVAAYPNYPIVITGLAAIDNNPYHVAEFMRDAFDYIDTTYPERVVAYAWSVTKAHSTSALYDSSTGELTDMSSIFADTTVENPFEDNGETMYSENLVVNGTFDNDLSGWLSDDSGSLTYIDASGDGAITDGTMKISSSNAYQKDLAVYDGETYTFSYDGRIESSNDTDYLEMVITYGEGEYVVEVEDELTRTYSSTTKTITGGITLPSGIESINLYFVASGGDAFVDNVSFKLYEAGDDNGESNDDIVLEDVGTTIYDIVNNLLYNSDFESNPNTGTGSSDTGFLYDADCVSWALSYPILGSGSLILGSDEASTTYQVVSVEAGKVYAFGFTGRVHNSNDSNTGQNENTDLDLVMYVACTYSGTQRNYYSVETPINSATTTISSGSFVAPYGVSEVRVYFAAPAGGYGYIDNAYFGECANQPEQINYLPNPTFHYMPATHIWTSDGNSSFVNDTNGNVTVSGEVMDGNGAVIIHGSSPYTGSSNFRAAPILLPAGRYTMGATCRMTSSRGASGSVSQPGGGALEFRMNLGTTSGGSSTLLFNETVFDSAVDTGVNVDKQYTVDFTLTDETLLYFAFRKAGDSSNVSYAYVDNAFVIKTSDDTSSQPTDIPAGSIGTYDDENMIVNAGFESGKTYWNMTGAAEVLTIGESGSPINSSFLAEDKMLSISSVASISQGITLEQSAVSSVSTYQLGFVGRAESATAKVNISVVDNLGGVQSLSLSEFSSTTTALYSASFTANSDATSYTLSIESDGGSGDIVYLDNIYFGELVGDVEEPLYGASILSNLLSNTGFQKSVVGGTGDGSWYYTSTSMVNDTENPINDTKSLLLGSSSASTTYQRVEVEGGKEYQFGFTGRIHSASGSASGSNENQNLDLTMYIVGTSSLGVTWSYASIATPATSATTQTYSAKFNVPLDLTEVLVYFSTTAGGYAYIDEVYFGESETQPDASEYNYLSNPGLNYTPGTNIMSTSGSNSYILTVAAGNESVSGEISDGIGCGMVYGNATNGNGNINQKLYLPAGDYVIGGTFRFVSERSVNGSGSVPTNGFGRINVVNQSNNSTSYLQADHALAPTNSDYLTDNGFESSFTLDADTYLLVQFAKSGNSTTDPAFLYMDDLYIKIAGEGSTDEDDKEPDTYDFAAAYPNNIVKNGSFESGFTSDWFESDGSTIVTTGTNYAIEQTYVINNEKSVVTYSQWKLLCQTVNVEAGATYRFGFTGRAQDAYGASGSSGSGSIKLALRTTYIGGSEVTQVFATSNTDGEVSGTYVVPSDYTSGTIDLVFVSTLNKVSYIDNVFMEKIREPMDSTIYVGEAVAGMPDGATNILANGGFEHLDIADDYNWNILFSSKVVAKDFANGELLSDDELALMTSDNGSGMLQLYGDNSSSDSATAWQYVDFEGGKTYVIGFSLYYLAVNNNSSGTKFYIKDADSANVFVSETADGTVVGEWQNIETEFTPDATTSGYRIGIQRYSSSDVNAYLDNVYIYAKEDVVEPDAEPTYGAAIVSNLVVNSGFESDIVDGATTGTPVGEWLYKNTLKQETNAEYVISGGGSLNLYTSDNYVNTQQYMDVIPGKKYLFGLTGRIHTDAVTDSKADENATTETNETLSMNIRSVSGTTTTTHDGVYASITSNQNGEISGSFVAPYGVTQVCVNITVGEGGGCAYVDDVYFGESLEQPLVRNYLTNAGFYSSLTNWAGSDRMAVTNNTADLVAGEISDNEACLIVYGSSSGKGSGNATQSLTLPAGKYTFGATVRILGERGSSGGTKVTGLTAAEKIMAHFLVYKTSSSSTRYAFEYVLDAYTDADTANVDQICTVDFELTEETAITVSLRKAGDSTNYAYVYFDDAFVIDRE